MDRLYNLVKNEYIKIYRKTSTRILLVIFLAVCICFAPLMKLINHVAMSQYAYDMDDTSYMQQDVENRKHELEAMAEGENSDPLVTYRLELCEAVDLSNAWQYRPYSYGMNANDKQTIQRMIMFCKADDWRGFLQYQLDNAKSPGEEWAAKYKLDHDIGFSKEEDIKNRLINDVANAMDGAYEEGIGSSGLSSEEKVAIGKYQLENEIYSNTSDKGGSLLNIDPSEKFDFWDVFLKTPYIVTLIGTIMLVIAGSSVASEFSQGTIKFLLINPVKRGRILISKYIAVMTLGIFMVIALMLINIPMIGIFFGFKGIGAPYLAVKNGEVIAHSTFFYLFKTYALASVEIIVTTTLAFMISSLLRSTALAIVSGFVIRSVGSTIIMIMTFLKMDWGRYLIFANTDLLSIANGESSFQEHTVGFALVIVVVHLIVFMLTAWDGFTRRSV